MIPRGPGNFDVCPERGRILAYGAAAVLTLGGIAAAVAGGLVGQVLAIAGITIGLGGALLLLFYRGGAE